MNKKKSIFIYSIKENVFLIDLYIKLINKHGKEIDTLILIKPRISNGFKKIINEIIYRINFWGFVSTLKFVIINSVYKFKSFTLKKKCKLHNVKLIKFDKNIEALSHIDKFAPDIVLTSIDYLVPERYLLNKTVFLNSHCSLLPKYKGFDSVFWALQNNEKNYGATILKISKTYDSGEILEQTKIKKNIELSYYSILRESYNLIYLMYDRLFENQFISKKLPNDNTKIYTRPESSLGKEFRKKGGKFF